MSEPQCRDIDWGDGATGTVVADADNGKESQATAIVRLAHENGVDLWHTPAGDGYITLPVTGHEEHHPLASRGTRD